MSAALRLTRKSAPAALGPGIAGRVHQHRTHFHDPARRVLGRLEIAHASAAAGRPAGWCRPRSRRTGTHRSSPGLPYSSSASVSPIPKLRRRALGRLSVVGAATRHGPSLELVSARSLAGPADSLGRARIHTGPDLLTLGGRPAARARLPQSRAGKSVLVGDRHFVLAWPCLSNSGACCGRNRRCGLLAILCALCHLVRLCRLARRDQIKATGSRAHRVRA